MAKTIPKGESPIDFSRAKNYFCKLKIGDSSINPINISSVIVREWIFDVVPRLMITLSDDGTLSELYNLKDQTEITLELSKTDSEEGKMVSTFTVDNWTVDYARGGRLIYIITAIKKAENLFYPIKTRAFRRKTSIQVLQQIASECGLNTKIATDLRTTDNMNWLQVNLTNFDMIKHVIKRGNVINDAFLSFIDTNNNLVITSLKNECSKEQSIIAKYSPEKTTAEVFSSTEDSNTIWFNGYRIENIESYYNKTVGYGIKYNYYDLTSKIDTTMNEQYHPHTSNGYQEGGTVEAINYGLKTSNVYDDYFKAQINNKYLKAISFSQRVAISINSLYPINLLDKVNLVIPSAIVGNDGKLNEIYSGEHIVCGISHSASSDGIFQKEISLHRNGFNNNSHGV